MTEAELVEALDRIEQKLDAALASTNLRKATQAYETRGK